MTSIYNNSRTNSLTKQRLAFLLGLLSSIQIRVIGTFSIAEILALLICPFVIKEVFSNRQAKIFMLMQCVWLIGVVFSDIINHSSTENSLKGAFNVILFIFIVPTIYWVLKEDVRRILDYCFGFGLSGLIQWQFFATFDDEYDRTVWLTYYIAALVCAVGYWLYYKGYKYWSLIVLEGFAFWTLFNDSRHIFLMVSLGAVVVLFYRRKHRNWVHDQTLFNRRLLPLLLLLGVMGVAATKTYSHLASSGTLGERAKYKYEMQASDEKGLASGRQDFLESLYAISKEPITGYGSYAKDVYGLGISYRYSQRYWNTFKYFHKDEESEMIPGHSHMLGAWVYAGILGFCFWVYVLGVIFLFLRKYICAYPRLFCYFVIATCLMIWDILFSPFANRLNFVFFIMPMLLTINHRGPVLPVNSLVRK